MKTYPAKLQAPVAAVTQTKKNSSLYLVKIFTVLFLFTSGFIYTAKSQCLAPTLSFHSPVLISGTDNQIGAVYLFPEVIPGVDAHIEIVDFVGGAALYNIDDSAGIGYYDAFQPYVVAPAGQTSYMDWKITFKEAGTDNDYYLPCLSITGVDVDGNGADLQEFIEAATPGSYALDPATILTFSFDGIKSKAISTIYNIPSIDTFHLEAMFQMNFTNISTLMYRNGAVSTHGGDMVRQTCIYFKPFFDSYTMLLPVKLLSFSAQSKDESVGLSWSATDENDLKYYIVQKSTDGIKWTDVNTVMPAKLNSTNNYYTTDNGKNNGVTYYRLKQIEKNGEAVYSKILKVKTGSVNNVSITQNTLVNNTVNMQISSPANDQYSFTVFTMNGAKVKQQQANIYTGYNTTSIDLPSSLSPGIYLMTVRNSRGELIYNSKMIRN